MSSGRPRVSGANTDRNIVMQKGSQQITNAKITIISDMVSWNSSRYCFSRFLWDLACAEESLLLLRKPPSTFDPSFKKAFTSKVDVSSLARLDESSASEDVEDRGDEIGNGCGTVKVLGSASELEIVVNPSSDLGICAIVSFEIDNCPLSDFLESRLLFPSSENVSTSLVPSSSGQTMILTTVCLTGFFPGNLSACLV